MTDLSRILLPGTGVAYGHPDEQGGVAAWESVSGVAGDTGLVRFQAGIVTPPPPPPGTGWPTSVLTVLSQPAIDFLTLPPAWVEVAYDQFDRNIARGRWGVGQELYPYMTRGGRWRSTKGPDSSGRGIYDPAAVSVSNGEMVQEIGILRSDGKRRVSRPMPLWGSEAVNPAPNTRKRSYAFRVDLLAKFPTIVNGTKVAYLGWGDSAVGEPGYYEIDYPEMKLGPDRRGNAFKHHRDTFGDNGAKDAWASLVANIGDWHLYSTIHHAWKYRGHATGYDEFYLDGKLIGRSTKYVSELDLYIALQAETYLKRDKVLPPPAMGAIVYRLFRVAELVAA